LTGHKLCATLEASHKPVIVAVNGYALGGGFELALACDFRICSDKAKFGTPESKLGVCCGFGGNVRLPRLIGRTKAKEILMTGEMMLKRLWHIIKEIKRSLDYGMQNSN